MVVGKAVTKFAGEGGLDSDLAQLRQASCFQINHRSLHQRAEQLPLLLSLAENLLCRQGRGRPQNLRQESVFLASATSSAGPLETVHVSRQPAIAAAMLRSEQALIKRRLEQAMLRAFQRGGVEVDFHHRQLPNDKPMLALKTLRVDHGGHLLRMHSHSPFYTLPRAQDKRFFL